MKRGNDLQGGISQLHYGKTILARQNGKVCTDFGVVLKNLKFNEIFRGFITHFLLKSSFFPSALFKFLFLP